MELRRTVIVGASLERVFDYLSDFTNAREWDPGTVCCARLSGDGGPGTTYANTSKLLGRETHLTYVVEELEAPHRIALRGHGRAVQAHDTMVLHTVSAGTEVIYTARFEFTGLARYLGPLLSGSLKRLGDGAEHGLRENLSRL
jgi:carbon monoxide dehydrogenase subunit G